MHPLHNYTHSGGAKWLANLVAISFFDDGVAEGNPWAHRKVYVWPILTYM